jgi:hypothetical protein
MLYHRSNVLLNRSRPTLATVYLKIQSVKTIGQLLDPVFSIQVQFHHAAWPFVISRSNTDMSGIVLRPCACRRFHRIETHPKRSPKHHRVLNGRPRLGRSRLLRTQIHSLSECRSLRSRGIEFDTMLLGLLGLLSFSLRNLDGAYSVPKRGLAMDPRGQSVSLENE